MVTVAPTSATVLPGETEQLVATVTGTDIDTVTWTTSAAAVATVDANGLVTVLETATAGQTATITATFKPGTDVELAQVDVQNKIKAIESRLPQTVRQQGLMVDAASSGFLMMVGLSSPNGKYSEIDVSDYMTRYVIEELKRVEGVGKVQNFGAEKAMRIWVDPDRLVSYGLSIQDVNTAIQNQNLPISPGRIGDVPALKGQQITIPLTGCLSNQA